MKFWRKLLPSMSGWIVPSLMRDIATIRLVFRH
jgi:hypothetical protein